MTNDELPKAEDLDSNRLELIATIIRGILAATWPQTILALEPNKILWRELDNQSKQKWIVTAELLVTALRALTKPEDCSDKNIGNLLQEIIAESYTEGRSSGALEARQIQSIQPFHEGYRQAVLDMHNKNT